MEYPETYKKRIKAWLEKLRFDKEYTFDEEHTEVTKICAEELKQEQIDYIVYVGKGMVIKKDNLDNLNNYFHYMGEVWDPYGKQWVKKLQKIPQRHQYAKIIGRRDPELGKRLMSKVNYPIPTDLKNVAKYQTEKDEISNKSEQRKM